MKLQNIDMILSLNIQLNYFQSRENAYNRNMVQKWLPHILSNYHEGFMVHRATDPMQKIKLF
jgi:hypothetical protein